jgi:hypothetical protein
MPVVSCLLFHSYPAGVAGSSPVAIGGGCIGDLFAEQGRASAMAVYNLGPLIGTFLVPNVAIPADGTSSLGPALGPVIGGFVAERIGLSSTTASVTHSMSFFFPRY